MFFFFSSLLPLTASLIVIVGLLKSVFVHFGFRFIFYLKKCLFQLTGERHMQPPFLLKFWYCSTRAASLSKQNRKINIFEFLKYWEIKFNDKFPLNFLLKLFCLLRIIVFSYCPLLAVRISERFFFTFYIFSSFCPEKLRKFVWIPSKKKINLLVCIRRPTRGEWERKKCSMVCVEWKETMTKEKDK